VYFWKFLKVKTVKLKRREVWRGRHMRRKDGQKKEEIRKENGTEGNV